MKISTLNVMPEFESISTISPVFSQYTAGVNILKDITGGVKAILGKRTTNYEIDIQKAREAVLKDLENQAEALNADALIGVQFQYSQIIDSNITLMTVYGSGTAIKEKRSN
ncbi:heavy metal-binding domain-containing protein [Enterococcus sp. LJL120]